MNNIVGLTKFDEALKVVYEYVSGSGYDEDSINEIDKAIKVIQSFRDLLSTCNLKLLIKESEITSLNDEISVLKARIEILECGVKSKYVNNQNLHNEINMLGIENSNLKKRIRELEELVNARFNCTG